MSGKFVTGYARPRPTGVHAVNEWMDAAWSPELGLWAAVSRLATPVNGAQVMTSPDGVNWTLRQAVTGAWHGIAWSPTLLLFCAVGYGDAGSAAMTSPNGINWTLRTTPGLGSDWISVAWGDGLDVFAACDNTAAANSRAQGVMTSPDGINWTARTTGSPPQTSDFTDMAWSTNLQRFFALGFAYDDINDDIVNWLTAGGAWFTFQGRAAVWAPARNEFNIVGTLTPSPGNIISPNGIVTGFGGAMGSRTWNGIAWAPALSLYAAVASDGTTSDVDTSPTGVTWTHQVTPTQGSWERVRWSPELGQFLAVSSLPNGTQVMTSPNGTTWTLQTTAT